MPPTDTINNINTLVDQVNQQATALGLTSNIPQVKPITPESISTNPAPAQVVPPPITTSAQTAQQNLAQPQAQNVQPAPPTLAQQQEIQTQVYGQEAISSFESLLRAQVETPGIAEITSEQYAAQGVDKLQAEVKKYDLQIMEEQNRLQNEIDAINNKGGGLQIGAQSEIQNATRQSLSYQTDLGMQRAFAQLDYQEAKATADRFIDAITEQNEKYIETLKLNYERNQDLFTTAQQREFQVKLSDYEREQQQIIDNEKLLKDTKLEAMRMLQLNGADQSLLNQVGQAKSPEEVLQIAGQAGVTDLLDRAYKRNQLAIQGLQYQSAAADLQKALTGQLESGLTPEEREKIGKLPETKEAQILMTLNSNLSRLAQLYKEHGTVNIFDPEAKRRINALRAQLEIDIAVAGGQGAISEQEADRYQNIVGGGRVFGVPTMTGVGVANAINEAIFTNDTKIKDKINYIDATYPGSTLFEPINNYLLSKKANDYIDSLYGSLSPATDGDAIYQYLNSFSTQ